MMGVTRMSSRIEDILQSSIDGTSYDGEAQSRIEELLLQLVNDSGGGNFKLIETINVTDANVSTIERTGYNFKKVFIRGRIAAGEAGVTQTIVGGFSCGYWSENANGGVADTFAQITNGMFFSEYAAQLTSLTSPGANTNLVRRELSYGQLTDKNIETVKITSSKSFPVGTTFEIYGV